MTRCRRTSGCPNRSPSRISNTDVGTRPPHPAPTVRAGSRRNRSGRSARPPAPTARPPLFARPDRPQWAHPEPGLHRRAASVSPRPAPAAESNSPRTFDSRPCTDCSSGPSRTPRCSTHPRRRHPCSPSPSPRRRCTSHFEISNDLPDDFSSPIQTPPEPQAPVDRTNTATDDLTPWLHPHRVKQELPSYYESVRQRAPHRYSVPHGVARSGTSLSPPHRRQYRDTPYRGRDRPCGRPPAQIPACATNALGSCLGSERENAHRGRDAPHGRAAAIEWQGGPSGSS